MWQRYLEKAIELGGDAEFVAVHSSPDGVDDGFVHYSVKWAEARGTPPRGTGEVYDLWGVTPGVELALWEFICNIDLVDEWFAEERPVDDVVQFAVADTRAVPDEVGVGRAVVARPRRRRRTDGAAIRRRRRRPSRIGVTDSLLPANTGVWSVAASGAKRLGDDAGADIAVDIRELSAAYLGGTRWSSLAAAGRVDVRNPAAARRRRRAVRRPRGAVLL